VNAAADAADFHAALPGGKPLERATFEVSGSPLRGSSIVTAVPRPTSLRIVTVPPD
jgi:hypothetical protein